MALESCFLSVDDDKPLAVWWADTDGCGVIPLDVFLEESKIDMSKNQAGRYAERLQQFVDDLKDYVGTGDSHE